MSTTSIFQASSSLRPRVHFTARKGWLNDPNGCVFHEGEWHLFYQHNPHGTDWGNMSWGHAVSRDLVHWDELPVALTPDDRGMIFSGSAVVDRDNSAGFQVGSEAALVAAFTYAGDHGNPKGPYTQALAYSTDRGRSWTKYANNPVLGNLTGGSDRDPKIFWHEASKRWIMVLFLDGGAGSRSFALFNSVDLKNWEMTQKLPGFFECPELFPLFMEDEGRTLWILQEASSEYLVGEFNGVTFEPLQAKRKLDFGPDYYAAQNFNTAPLGKQVQIAWLRGNCFPGEEFNQQMSFPSELRLEKDELGHVVCRRFMLDFLEREKIAFGDVRALGEWGNDPVYLNLGGRFSAEIEIVVNGMSFRIQDGVVYKNEESFALASKMEIYQVEILIDRASVEILLNAGRAGGSFAVTAEASPTPWKLVAPGLSQGFLMKL